MQYSVIRKMEKARQYAEQKERVAISSIKTTFHGNPQRPPRYFQRRQMVLLMRLFLRLRRPAATPWPWNEFSTPCSLPSSKQRPLRYPSS